MQRKRLTSKVFMDSFKKIIVCSESKKIDKLNETKYSMEMKILDREIKKKIAEDEPILLQNDLQTDQFDWA